MKKSIAIVGPYATEYSLARVNRALAYEMSKHDDFEIFLWANEEQTDRLPNKEDYKKYPFLKNLEKENIDDVDIVLYNNFPKDPNSLYGLKDLPGKTKYAYIAWEESIYPDKFVKECNENLNAMFVPSEHTRIVFQNSGMNIPIFVIHEGLDIGYKDSEYYDIKTKKNFKFLHISSAHIRKGVDVLLKAYLAEFKKTDDVSLILKIFSNASIDSNVSKLLDSINENSPEVVLIKSSDLTDGQMRFLYENSDAVVLPTRAEGFGLTMAEAMLIGKPLITTGFSGHMDFCNEYNSFLIDYKLANSQGHLNILGSKTATPDQQSLQKLMRYVFENKDSKEVKNKVELAKIEAQKLTWENCVHEFFEKITQLEKLKPLKNKNFAVVSSWNSTCGIAQYSYDLYSNAIGVFKSFTCYSNTNFLERVKNDEAFVKRNWEYGEKNFEKLSKDII